MKKQFYENSEEIYLNSGTQSKVPLEVIEQTEKARLTGYKNPVAAHLSFPAQLYQAHLAFGDFINADPNDLFFTQNVTESLNHFLMGIKIPSDAQVIVPDFEYGATLNICRYKCETENIQLKIPQLSHLYLDESKSPSEVNKEIISFFETEDIPQNSIVVLSHVLTGNGAITPIQEISAILRKKKCHLVVDGAHAIGAFDLNFNDFQDIIFYGGNLHKWMMGMPGTGMGWINPHLKKDLNSKLLFVGWPNFDNAFHLDDFKLEGTAKEYYLKGTLDFAKFNSINFLLDFWRKTGKDEIFKKRQSLREILKESIDQHSRIRAFTTIDSSSPLLTYKLDSPFNEQGFQIAQGLYEQYKIVIASPEFSNQTVLRLSPNIYNTEDEMLFSANKIIEYFSNASV